MTKAITIYRVEGPDSQLPEDCDTPEEACARADRRIYISLGGRQRAIDALKRDQAYTFAYEFKSVTIKPILQLQDEKAQIEELLARGEALQRQVKDLEGLRDTVLEPVLVAHFAGELTAEQTTRLFSATAVPPLERDKDGVLQVPAAYRRSGQ